MKRQVKVKDYMLGDNSHIYIQSMCNTKTHDVDSTVKQILDLEKAGCEIVRVAVLDVNDAHAISKIKEQIHIPLVADIHFDYRLALIALEEGVDKLRFNPVNIQDESKIKEIVDLAKIKKVPIRVGINAGGLKERDNKVGQMIDLALKNVKLLEDNDFHDIVLSFKTSNLEESLEVNRLASKLFDYPLHIGLTEAGTLIPSTVNNTILIKTLLDEGIGDTVRVSIADDPLLEVKVAKEILKSCGKYSGPKLVACPTCGRTSYNMLPLAQKIDNYLDTINKKITVAVMGCIVNGPGEARDADIGVAGGKGEAVLFKKGEVIRRIKEEDLYEELVKEIDKL